MAMQHVPRKQRQHHREKDAQPEGGSHYDGLHDPEGAAVRQAVAVIADGVVAQAEAEVQQQAAHHSCGMYPCLNKGEEKINMIRGPLRNRRIGTHSLTHPRLGLYTEMKELYEYTRRGQGRSELPYAGRAVVVSLRMENEGTLTTDQSLGMEFEIGQLTNKQMKKMMMLW